MPDIKFETKESIPEGLGEYAKEVDGKWIVKVVPEVKLNEFRDKNITLSKENDTLKSKEAKIAPIIGENVDEFITNVETWKDTAQKVADGKLKASGDIEAELEKRTKTMKDGYERTNQELRQKLTSAETKALESDKKFRRSIVDRTVTAAVIDEKSGVEPSALTDILNRAYNVFQVDDNDRLIAKDGDAQLYGADGASPLTPAEWLGTLKEKAPHFFKPSTGGNAGGNDGKKFGGLSKEDFQKLPASQRLKMANEGKLK